ncbi:MAG TPA: hypothetical protein PLX89_21405 [Verrucomicrobiota bacterium]|nr:hypothetical protein [Verrucomicrobiota bacterium]
MALGEISQQFLKNVEGATGLPVHVETDSRLEPPLLARVQVARRGVPLHRVVFHPNARGMADYLIAFQCSFVLRLFALPVEERFDLTINPTAEGESLAWAKTHPASASLSPDRQAAFAEFLRTSLMSMLRSIPVGLWIDHDLRNRFPELREAQEQAARRQLDTHASLLRPEIQRSVPEPALRINLAINAAFAKFWSRELDQSGLTLPYLTVGALQKGEALLAKSDALEPGPANDRRLIQTWADELGLGGWILWLPYSP